MSRHRFRYLALRGRNYPLIPIKLFYGKANVITYALVDSGATLSVFRADIADYLGFRLENGERIALQSATTSLMVYVHRLRAALGKDFFDLRVGFARDLLTSFNILGREGFFEKFLVIFNEVNREISIETVHN